MTTWLLTDKLTDRMMDDKIYILEYEESGSSFNYNSMQYVTNTRGFRPIAVCQYCLLEPFVRGVEDMTRSGRCLSYDDVCTLWQGYWADNRSVFLERGWR